MQSLHIVNRLRLPEFRQTLLIAGCALLVFCITAGLFSPALRYDFIGLDDAEYVTNNIIIHEGLSAESLIWAATNVKRGGYWAPLLWGSYLVDVSLFGYHPWGFHLTNVLLHALNACLLFLLLRRWSGNLVAAFFIALLWAVHPLRVESVAWITERKDVLSGFFFLLCIGAYTRCKPGNARGNLLWTSLFLACGMLVKAGALIITPFVLLLLDIWPLRRFDWKISSGLKLAVEKWGCWLVAFGIGGFFYWITADLEIVRSNTPALWPRLALIPGNYLTYLNQTLRPLGLAILYNTPIWALHRFVLAVFLMAIGFAWAYLNRKTYPELLTGLLWTIGVFFPSIGFIWVGSTEGLGDRFSYLPAIGFAIFQIGIWRLLCTPFPRVGRTLIGIAAILTLLYADLTLRQLPFWKDNGTMTRRTLQISPGNMQSHIMYGNQLAKEGLWQESLDVLWRIFNLRHPLVEVWDSVALAQLNLGHPEDALKTLESAPEEIKKLDTKLLKLMITGQALLDLGRPQEAIPHFEEALRLNPELEAIDYMCAAFEAGYAKEAVAFWAKNKNTSPVPVGRLEDLMPLFVQKWEKLEKVRAATYFRKLIARNPENMVMLNNFAWMFAVDEKQTVPPEETLKIAQQAASLMPKPDPAVLDTLAAAQANAGLFEEASQTADQAMTLAQKQTQPLLAQDIALHLQAYREHRPWREP